MVEYVTIKIVKTIYDELDKLRIPRPDIGPNSYEKSFSVVIADLIKNNKGVK